MRKKRDLKYLVFILIIIITVLLFAAVYYSNRFNEDVLTSPKKQFSKRAPLTANSVTRFLPTTYTPGMSVNVTLTLNADPSVNFVTVSDAAPPGWQVLCTPIANQGCRNDSGQARWTRSNDLGTGIPLQNLTYFALPPGGESGTKTFSGSYTYDGSSKVIEGMSTINQAITAPYNLIATAFSSSQINLMWTDNSTNEEGFKIERSLSQFSGFNEIASVGRSAGVGGSVNYADSNSLIADTPYFYKVRAYNGSLYSDYSNINSVRTLPAGIPISSCGVISAPGYYILTNNLITSEGCLGILTDNVVLDGNGFSITGSGSQVWQGVYIGNANNVVKNLNISNFRWGIRISGQDARNNVIINVVSSNNYNALPRTYANGGNGIRIDNWASNNTIKDSKFFNNLGAGIEVNNVNDTIIKNNNISRSSLAAVALFGSIYKSKVENNYGAGNNYNFGGCTGNDCILPNPPTNDNQYFNNIYT